MGQARHLLRARRPGLFRDHPQGARRGEDPAGISRIVAAEKTVAPAEIEEAFIKVNPGLSASAISVVCGSKRLSEVRICMSKDLQFRACEEIDRRACRRDEVVMPPMRGG